MSDESTTPDLEERSRWAVDAFNRRDWDALLADFAPDAVWDGEALGTFEGRDAIRRFLEDWIEAYDEYEEVAREPHDLGNGVWFAISRSRGRPKGSTELLELRFALVATEADGLIERLMARTDIDAARATAERLAQERG
jgi:ketosteroid isomerase-like protein